MDDLNDLVGMKVAGVEADEFGITLCFENGMSLQISADGGSGINEGQAFLKAELLGE